MHDSKNLEEKKKKTQNSTLAKELNFHGKKKAQIQQIL
jgi:hypothetical protein